MRKVCVHGYDDIISIENLLEVWKEFLKDKRKRKDVQEFEHKLMENIILLHNDLVHKTYRHSQYETFNISDPKPRNIHKATVRDRLLHRAIYRKLYPFFDKTFISDSYSCRKNKGTHKALSRFRDFSYKVSKNNTKTAWVLKCDIRKFFASIDRSVLVKILEKCISDRNILRLVSKIINSFSLTKDVGLPLGNLTSQLFVNIYMNEFDQFVKHKLKVKYYIRYADDFVFFSQDKEWLVSLIPQIRDFLREKLKLTLHPQKISMSTIASGVDFLGWVHFPDYGVLRTVTKRRMFSRLTEDNEASYLGMLKHGNTYKLKESVRIGV